MRKGRSERRPFPLELIGEEKHTMKIKKRWYALFTVPLMVMFFLIIVIPFITGIGYSFVSWDGLAKSEKVFVGLNNYKRIFSDTQFLTSIVRTTVFTLVTVVIVNVLALAFALLVIGGLILGYIWQYVLGEAMTALADMTGMENIFFNWLVDSDYAFYAMIVVATWQMAGYMMIVYIAGLESISDDVMEAAQTDGANYWQTLIRVRLPLLMSSITICLFLTLSNCFKIYDVNVSLTGGGPNNSTEMVSMNIFNEIFTKSNFGYGQAKAVLFFIIVAIITLIQVKVTKDKEVTM